MTNNELFEIFSDYNNRNFCKGTSLPRNSLIKCHFLPLFGNDEVGNATPSTINSVYDEMEAEGLRANTIFGEQSALYSYFRFAIEQGEMNENPVSNARKVMREQ